MNKLLGVSIAAMLAVTPMMANAANSVAQLPTYEVEQANTNIATTSYVKGAYNAVANQVNNVRNDITVDTSAAKNISASNTIGGNVTALDTAVGNVGTIATVADNGSVLKTANTTDLVGAVVAINNALATATGDATVAQKQGGYNQITAGVSTANNLVALDTAIGQVGSSKTYLTTIGDGTGEVSVGDNLNALNDAIGNITTTGEYILPIGTGEGKKTIAQNLKDLDTQVELNRGAVATLNGSVSTDGSVLKTIKENAQTADFTATASGLSNGTLAQAINQVQTNLNSANTDAALLEGNYYYHDTVTGENGHTKDTVAGAIQKVDAQVKRNEQAITAINNTQIPLFGNWASETASGNVTIAQLTAGN
jgi:hypothetical protein